MRKTSLVRSLVAALPFGLALSACTAAPAPSETATLAVTCSGKCDGLTDIPSYLRDPKKLELADLAGLGVGFATKELNGALSSNYSSLEIMVPKLYALEDRARKSPILGNIDLLVSGLAVRFGERELTTEVNAVRRATLQSAGGLFGECAFRINAQIAHTWNMTTGGLATSWVGFDAGGTLEARVVARFAKELDALGGAPLAAISDLRGFVLPRSISDIRAMKAGESYALRGSGRLGMNVGVGVPLLIANPATFLTYSLVLSASLRAALEGELDVQLVRMTGDELVIDVGIEKAAVLDARLAIDDGWGVQGLLKERFSIAGQTIDLGRLVDNALRNSLNQKLKLSARLESDTTRSRLSVARLRFSLDGGGDPAAIEQAIAQALRGDVRLAQALANRGEPGVVAEFDLSRSGLAATSYAGIDVFGMAFFHDVEHDQGTVTIQTPGGVRTVLFDSLHRGGGWFYSTHGSTRVGLSGLVFNAQNPTVPQGEVNLFFQIMEGDEYMKRDRLLAHLDGVIRQVGGDAALAAVEGPGNELERYVRLACPDSPAYDACRTTVLTDAKVVKLRADGQAALADAVSGFEQSQRDLLLAAGKLRLTAQATVEPVAALVGPRTSVVLDERFDNAALNELMVNRTGDDFGNAVVGYLQATQIDRESSADAIASARSRIAEDHTDKLNALRDIYDSHRDAYQRLSAAEATTIETLGAIGPHALEVRFDVDAANTPKYEDATARSLSQARAKTIEAMVDELQNQSGGLGRQAEQVVAYGLLGMTPASSLDLRLDIAVNLTNNWAQDYTQYRQAGYAPLDAYTRGSAVAPIDGGLFNIDALTHL